ncbi:MAG: O-antigen ligase family protein [Ramlibacter sp.]
MAVLAALLLLFAAPLMRGGNRQVALIALEAIALTFMLSLWLRMVFASASLPIERPHIPLKTVLIVFVLSSPAWLAIVYLVPVPTDFWFAAAGRDIYRQLLGDVGITPREWQPLSLVPDATWASLMAGLPLVAGFLAGYLARLSQIKLLLGFVVAMAFAQILLGLMQIGGGAQSALHVGMYTDRPIGSFANPNHFANYLAMALAAYVWLGWDSILGPRRRRIDNPAAKLASRHAMPLWLAGGVVLVLGILLSRSRGAALTGLPAAMLALGLALSFRNHHSSWRFSLLVVAGMLIGAISMMGMGTVLSRFDLGELSSSAIDRALLASSTFEGANAFWPWGAGWGTYAAVYPRFQPLVIQGIADYAHHDYAQMLFEGGVFSVLLLVTCLWLTGSRAVVLVRSALQYRKLSHDDMASALCGMGLLGLLLHSLVEFNMHILANAILGALLAGVYLRSASLENAQR